MTSQLKQKLCAEFEGITDSLGIAAANGNTAALDRMFSNDWTSFTWRDILRRDKFICVHVAAAKGHINVLQFLLDKQIIGARDFNFACISEETHGSIARVAVVFNQIVVLDWMLYYFRRCASYNIHTPLLVKFIMREKQLNALQWAFDRNLVRTEDWGLCGNRTVLDWFARRLPVNLFSARIDGVAQQIARYEYERGGVLTAEERKKLWTDVRRESVLATVVAGKKHGLRLPPELWELVEEYFT